MPDYYTLSLTVLFDFSLLPTILFIGFSYSMGKQFESIMFTTGQSVGKITLAGGSTDNICNIQCGPNLIIRRYWPNVPSTGSVHFLKINRIDEINWDRTNLIRTVFPLIICLLFYKNSHTSYSFIQFIHCIYIDHNITDLCPE